MIMLRLGLGFEIVYFLCIFSIVAAQITSIGNEAYTCSGSTFNFTWNYTSGVSILLTLWKLNGSTNIAIHDIGGSLSFTPSTGYETRLTKISDVGISLSSLSESDYGQYTCSVTDSNGNTILCPTIALFVYDPWSEVLGISKSGGGDSVMLQSSIEDNRTSYTWIFNDQEVGSGFQYKATENGNYTLTLGKRGLCLIGASSKSITVSEILGCKYLDAELFLGGFSCFLIVFGITSIIMLIFLLCQMLPKIFDDKKTNKIIIIVVFNSLALIFGFALGFGLKECEKRDLGLGLGLGFGFILAIALFLTLYIYHKQCGSKKENEDENRESPPKFNSKKPEDSPKRVGSPASTSNIKMESKLNS